MEARKMFNSTRSGHHFRRVKTGRVISEVHNEIDVQTLPDSPAAKREYESNPAFPHGTVQ
jgi:hypothetical protein